MTQYTLEQSIYDTTGTDATPSVHKTIRMDVYRLPVDILVLIFSGLPGQDIARCLAVSGSSVIFKVGIAHYQW